MIRAATRRDADLLATLQGESFPEDPWPALGFMQLMADPNVAALVAEPDGRPAGFALVRTVADEAEVIAVGVRPGDRRGGIGRALLEAMVARARDRGARSLFLEVAEDNPVAQALYISRGFLQVGRRPGYYRRKESSVAALILRLEIGAETIPT